MKTHQEIQAQIAATRQLPKFDQYPAIIECWNEYEKFWRDDNGRSYMHWVVDRPYEYHLIYFDEHLVVVERNGVTLFSHITARLTKIMEGYEEPVKFRDDYPIISLEELAALPRLKNKNRV